MRESKTQQLFRQLRERIESGVYPIGSRFPSEYLLADEFEVNKKTANKAVDMLVSTGLLKRGTGGAGTVVVKNFEFPKGQIAFFSDPSGYPMRILTGVQKCALEYGYAVTVFFPESTDCGELLASLVNSNVCGFIFCSQFGYLADKTGLPAVLVDHFPENDSPVDALNTDDRLGGKLMMDEVLRRGHRKIAVYSSGRHYPIRQFRIAGFMESMRDAGFTSPQKQIFYGTAFDDLSATEALGQILEQEAETSIIVCDADDAACSMLKAVRKLKKEITITSYGNSLNGADRLAAIEQFPERLGSAACRRLMHNISAGISGSGYRELISPQVVCPDEIPVIAGG